MGEFCRHADKRLYALVICFHGIGVCKESRPAGLDFVIVSAFKGVLPENLVIRHGFIEPGLCGKVEMDDLRIVELRHGTARHAVPARVKIMDMVLAKGIEIILVRGNRTKGIIRKPAHEFTGDIVLPESFEVHKKNARIHISPVIDAHIFINVLHKRADMLDAVIGHCPNILISKGFLPEPGDVSRYYNIGVKIYPLVILREKHGNKEAEINAEGTEGLEPVRAQAVKTPELFGQRVEFNLEILTLKSS